MVTLDDLEVRTTYEESLSNIGTEDETWIDRIIHTSEGESDE